MPINIDYPKNYFYLKNCFMSEFGEIEPLPKIFKSTDIIVPSFNDYNLDIFAFSGRFAFLINKNDGSGNLVWRTFYDQYDFNSDGFAYVDYGDKLQAIAGAPASSNNMYVSNACNVGTDDLNYVFLVPIKEKTTFDGGDDTILSILISKTDYSTQSVGTISTPNAYANCIVWWNGRIWLGDIDGKLVCGGIKTSTVDNRLNFDYAANTGADISGPFMYPVSNYKIEQLLPVNNVLFILDTKGDLYAYTGYPTQEKISYIGNIGNDNCNEFTMTYVNGIVWYTNKFGIGTIQQLDYSESFRITTNNVYLQSYLEKYYPQNNLYYLPAINQFLLGGLMFDPHTKMYTDVSGTDFNTSEIGISRNYFSGNTFFKILRVAIYPDITTYFSIGHISHLQYSDYTSSIALKPNIVNDRQVYHKKLFVVAKNYGTNQNISVKYSDYTGEKLLKGITLDTTSNTDPMSSNLQTKILEIGSLDITGNLILDVDPKIKILSAEVK